MSTRVITQLGATDPHRGLISEAHPEVELVDFSGDPPDGLQADVFFGGYMGWDQILRWLDATGVRWVQLSGTGVDKVPDAVYDGRIVTCARGAAAVPIAEWVIAAIIASGQALPRGVRARAAEVLELPDPAARLGRGEHGWHRRARRYRPSPSRNGQCALGMNVRAMRRTDTPSPIEGVELVTRHRSARSTERITSCSRRRRRRGPSTSSTRVFARRSSPASTSSTSRAARWWIRTRCESRSMTAGSPLPRSTRSIPSRCRRATGSTRIRRCSSSAHVSWYTPELQRTAVEIFVDNLGRFLRDEPLLYIVDRDEGY